MRLASVCSIEEASSFVHKVYLSGHNQRFVVEAGQSFDLHKMLIDHDLSIVFCIKEKRIVNNDFTLSYKIKLAQLQKEQKTIVRKRVYCRFVA